MNVYDHNTKIPRRVLRTYHFVKQNGVCAYCGCQMNRKRHNRDDNSVTLEHIIPVAYGGLNCEFHTIAICYRCNQERGNNTLTLAMILGIFIFKGFDAIIPISMSYWNRFIFYKKNLTKSRG